MKVAVMTYFKVLSYNFPGETETEPQHFHPLVSDQYQDLQNMKQDC
jgi:hypothetical protein